MNFVIRSTRLNDMGILSRLTSSDRSACIEFLRDLARIPSFSGQEGDVAQRLAEEMRRVGFAEVYVDRAGNVIGRAGIGRPDRKLVFNGHMDHVGVGDLAAWSHDPFGAEIEDGFLFGRGVVDMKGALAAMVYGAKLLLDAGAWLPGDLYVVGVVQEEPAEGTAMRWLVEEEGLHPDFVVLGEPTHLRISRGQRGRLEMRVTTHGRSCHASTPDLGDNAIYAATRLIFGIELLARQLTVNDPVLGSGSVAVTQIESESGSRNVIPDQCTFVLDRRLTLGETEARALAEIQQIIQREDVRAEVIVPEFEMVTYTGQRLHGREYYPAWLMPEDHPLVRAGLRAVERSLGTRPRLCVWSFSTDGVYTMGEMGIPTIGFGPGEEHLAHTADERIRLDDVIQAAHVYANMAQEILTTPSR
ncbi:MAG: YgeY family selenium metabolism-linked hydrolase [Chloroflexi bacterium]|nr:YgeY family selenium metabolism-linked hydrolase [Chloroflexota bacterium]